MAHNSLMSSSPPRTSPKRGRGIDLDSPIDETDSLMAQPRQSGRSSIRSSIQPRSPNVRQIAAQSRPHVMLRTDETGDTDAVSEQGNLGGTIWGTNVNVDDVFKKFRRFIQNYEKDGQAIYPQLIEDAIESETWNLNIDCLNLYEYNRELYSQLVQFPQEVLPALDNVVNSYAEEYCSDLIGEASTSEDIWVRPFNLRLIRSMRNMNPSDIDQLVCIRGMVIRSTSIIPDVQTAFFRCQLCHDEIEVPIEMGRIQEPMKCNNQSCQGTNCMELIHNRSRFQDKQLVKVQETPENIPDGETPQTIDVYCFDLMVDLCRPGDRVEITGVYRASAIRPNPRRREIEAVYKTYIDSVHIKKTRNNQMEVDDSMNGETDDTKTEEEQENEERAEWDDTNETSQERENRISEFKKLASDPNIYEKLVNSLAPSIWQMEDIKKGILCQLFGATKKDFSTAGGSKFRNQLNVLLCGDPGTSKSQLLSYVHKVAPRGIYTSGKGSSAVGLTAYITKDPDSGDLVLESGALVLSDKGICCIDEFDKMSESARSILHEVMEQQTVSIAKAGIICTLNARTSILAAANPIESRYNPTKSVVENIDLPPTLMSRFDLIYLVLDRPNENLDRRLAKHLVSLYYNQNDFNEVRAQRPDIIQQTLLMKYISYARKECQPELTEDACNKLIEAYTELRSMGREAGKKVITATPRQLESLIRISEAISRMRLSKYVTESDVDEALRLHKVATLAAATDPRTGAIDLDSIAVGRSMEEGKELQEQASLILEILSTYKRRTIRVSSLLKKYNEKSEQDTTAKIKRINTSDLRKIVERLEQADKLRPGDWLHDDPMITIISTDPM